MILRRYFDHIVGKRMAGNLFKDIVLCRVYGRNGLVGNPAVFMNLGGGSVAAF
jgi:hypothetical protein